MTTPNKPEPSKSAYGTIRKSTSLLNLIVKISTPVLLEKPTKLRLKPHLCNILAVAIYVAYKRLMHL